MDIDSVNDADDTTFITRIVDQLITNKLSNLDEYPEDRIKLNVYIVLISNFLKEEENQSVCLDVFFSLFSQYYNSVDIKGDNYLVNETLSLVFTYLFYYNVTNMKKLDLSLTKFLAFMSEAEFAINTENLFILKQFFKKIQALSINDIVGKSDTLFLEKLNILQNNLEAKYNDKYASHEDQFKNQSYISSQSKIHHLIFLTDKNKEDLVIHYETCMKILASPIQTFNCLIENRNIKFKSLDAIISRLVELLEKVISATNIVNHLTPLESKLNQIVANKNIREYLSNLGISTNSFLKNTDDSSEKEIELLYEPLSKVSFQHQKVALSGFTTVDSTLINNGAYLKLLIVNLAIKLKRFVRYMQDLKLFEKDFDKYFSGKNDVKNEIIKSIKFGDFNYWRKLLIKHQERIIEYMDDESTNRTVDFLISKTSDGNCFNYEKLAIQSTAYEGIPNKPFIDNVFFDGLLHGVSFSENKVNIDLQSLNNKIDDYRNMAVSSQEDKTQEDWCAYNVLFKYNFNSEQKFLLSEQLFKKTNIKKLFRRVYFNDGDFEDFKEKTEKEIQILLNAANEKDIVIQQLREKNERLTRILNSSNLIDPLEQNTKQEHKDGEEEGEKEADKAGAMDVEAHQTAETLDQTPKSSEEANDVDMLDFSQKVTTVSSDFNTELQTAEPSNTTIDENNA